MEFEADGARWPEPRGAAAAGARRGPLPPLRFVSCPKIAERAWHNVTEKCKSEGMLAQSGPVLLLSQTERSLLFIMQIDARAVGYVILENFEEPAQVNTAFRET